MPQFLRSIGSRCAWQLGSQWRASMHRRTIAFCTLGLIIAVVKFVFKANYLVHQAKHTMMTYAHDLTYRFPDPSLLDGSIHEGVNGFSQCSNADYRQKNDNAVWTFLTVQNNESAYSRGIHTLGESVRKHSNKALDFVVMQLEGQKELDAQLQDSIRADGWQLCTVPRIAPMDENATTFRFRDQFTKLHLWGMTQYRGILYLDADTLVVGAIDELFGEAYLGPMRDWGAGITAAQDIREGSWVSTFNMGVFLLVPNATEHSRLLALQRTRVWYEVAMAEQGFLNVVYSRHWHPLPFKFNANLAVLTEQPATWKEAEEKEDIRIVHYTVEKPWKCPTDSPRYRICEWWPNEERSQTRTECNVTVVTAYYPLQKAKHSMAEYRWWMRTGVLRLDSCLVAFVPDEATASWLRASVPPNSRVSLKIEQLPMAAFSVSLAYSEKQWEQQLAMDLEQFRHSVELYKVWAEKGAFLRRVVDANPFRSKFFVWIDVGSLRNGVPALLAGKPWPSSNNVQHLPPERVWFGQVQEFEPEDFVLDSEGLSASTTAPSKIATKVSISGAVFGGTRAAVLRFSRAYERLLATRMANGLFSGKDQSLHQDLAVGWDPLVCTFKGGWFVLHERLLTRGWEVCAGLCRAPPPALASVPMQAGRRGQCVNADYEPREAMAAFTFLTLERNRAYLAGAVKLARSVREHTRQPLDLVAMQLEGEKELDAASQAQLRGAGWQLCTVRRIPPFNENATFPRFRDQFTKLHLWGMTQYRGILYLDADTLVVGAIDELFGEAYLGPMRARGSGIAAARDIYGGKVVETFNMGVFLAVPNQNEFRWLLELQACNRVDFRVDQAEQGFLNVVYRERWTELPLRFNANLAFYSQMRELWDQHAMRVAIVHFTMTKPWSCGAEYRHICEWWLKA